VIYVQLKGGLGNQMFQYALGRHLALKNQTKLIVDTTYFDYIPKNSEHFVKREYDLDIFNIDAEILEPGKAKWLPYYSNKGIHRLKHFIKKHLNLYKYKDDYLVLYENEYFSFDEEILGTGKNAYLIGYWQNEKYFKDIENQILKDFTFKSAFGEHVQDLAKEIADSNSVCLNIRRGDFVNNPVHGFVGMDYASKAINCVREKTAIHKIYVFSDEIDWCMQNIKPDVPHFFVTHDYAGRKFSSYLYLMTQCRHFIIPNSTFGWWAAWLSVNREKIVIAPKRWVNVPGLDASDIIPEGWLTM
jgi:hypothetical protein